MHQKDKALLEQIRNYFGAGKICKSGEQLIQLIIESMKELPAILDHFFFFLFFIFIFFFAFVFIYICAEVVDSVQGELAAGAVVTYSVNVGMNKRKKKNKSRNNTQP